MNNSSICPLISNNTPQSRPVCVNFRHLKCFARRTSFSAIRVVVCKKPRRGNSCCDSSNNRMKIKRLPHVLALHLKRFKYQETLGRYTKLFYRVPFPTQLRLPNTSDDTEDPDRLYELFSVVVHIGKYVLALLALTTAARITAITSVLSAVEGDG
jgi:ubiquitin C-terminal hydrolase